MYVEFDEISRIINNSESSSSLHYIVVLPVALCWRLHRRRRLVLLYTYYVFLYTPLRMKMNIFAIRQVLHMHCISISTPYN